MNPICRKRYKSSSRLSPFLFFLVLTLLFIPKDSYTADLTGQKCDTIGAINVCTMSGEADNTTGLIMPASIQLCNQDKIWTACHDTNDAGFLTKNGVNLDPRENPLSGKWGPSTPFLCIKPLYVCVAPNWGVCRRATASTTPGEYTLDKSLTTGEHVVDLSGSPFDDLDKCNKNCIEAPPSCDKCCEEWRAPDASNGLDAGYCYVKPECLGGGTVKDCSSVTCPENTACATYACNPATLACDVSYKSTDTICRPADASGCDVAEYCDGSSAVCPLTDSKKAPGTTCGTTPPGDCENQDTCNNSGACVDNGFKSSDTVCRASTGTCDVAEKCTGASAACPSDAFANTETVCQAVDVNCFGKKCDGSGNCSMEFNSGGCGPVETLVKCTTNYSCLSPGDADYKTAQASVYYANSADCISLCKSPIKCTTNNRCLSSSDPDYETAQVRALYTNIEICNASCVSVNSGTTPPALPYCGNGKIEPQYGEECEPGLPIPNCVGTCKNAAGETVTAFTCSNLCKIQSNCAGSCNELFTCTTDCNADMCTNNSQGTACLTLNVSSNDPNCDGSACCHSVGFPRTVCQPMNCSYSTVSVEFPLNSGCIKTLGQNVPDLPSYTCSFSRCGDASTTNKCEPRTPGEPT